ncbi:MAG: hypothetical protein RLZZ303_3404 [Candidatus Hydrogenedentota bacterium]|jgi:hypothetical protein
MMLNATSLPLGTPATLPPSAVAGRMARSVDDAALMDSVFNLSRGTGETAALYAGMRAAAQDPEGGEFLTMLATMLKQGIVGTEQLEVRGERYTSFIENRIAAPDDVSRARPYRDVTSKPRLDLRA